MSKTADPTIDNGALTDVIVDATTLSGSANVQRIEVVTAVEGGASTNLAKAEDAAHASGDFGVMLMAVRNDALTALAGTTLDYIPLTTDSLGRLQVVLAGASAMPGALATTDSVTAVSSADTVMFNGTAYAVQYGTISRATAADGAAIANLSSGKKVLLLSVHAVCEVAVGMKFVSSTSNSSGAGTNVDLDGTFVKYAANTGPNWGRGLGGHLITATSAGLKLHLDGAQQVTGNFSYAYVI